MTLGKYFLLGFTLFVTSIAWAAEPIHNIVDEAVPIRFDGNPRTIEDVQNAVVKGCQRKGWSPVPAGENEITCTILVRGRHYAEVSISYSESSYSILYVSSRVLDYDEKKQRIHRNYNRWVLNLSAAIKQEFDLN